MHHAKLDTGTVEYDTASVLVREALIAAASLVAPQARAKGLALETSECPRELTGPTARQKLRQVPVSLLSNAVNYTGSGGPIEVSHSSDIRARIMLDAALMLAFPRA